MQGDAARDLAFKKIEEKLMTKGINLAVLDNQELAEIAIRFTGDAPPDHLPRETIIDILSEQQSLGRFWENYNGKKTLHEVVKHFVEILNIQYYNWKELSLKQNLILRLFLTYN